MGDRAYVKFVYENNDVIYFYTHNGGSSLDLAVHSAIAKRCRWNDDDYLARMIFSHMLWQEGGDLLGDEGFGICNYEPEREHPEIVIVDGTVYVGERAMSFDWFARNYLYCREEYYAQVYTE